MNPTSGHAEVHGEPMLAQLNQRPLCETLHRGDVAAHHVCVRLLLTRPRSQRGPPPCESWVVGELWIDDHEVE
jgi:hypothetical protein